MAKKKKSKRSGRKIEPHPKPKQSSTGEPHAMPGSAPEETPPDAQSIFRSLPDDWDRSAATLGREDPDRARAVAEAIAALGRAVAGPIHDHGRRDQTEESLGPDRRAILGAGKAVADHARLLPLNDPLRKALNGLFLDADDYASCLRPPEHAPAHANWSMFRGGALVGRCNGIADALRAAAGAPKTVARLSAGEALQRSLAALNSFKRSVASYTIPRGDDRLVHTIHGALALSEAHDDSSAVAMASFAQVFVAGSPIQRQEGNTTWLKPVSVGKGKEVDAALAAAVNSAWLVFLWPIKRWNEEAARTEGKKPPQRYHVGDLITKDELEQIDASARAGALALGEGRSVLPGDHGEALSGEQKRFTAAELTQPIGRPAALHDLLAVDVKNRIAIVRGKTYPLTVQQAEIADRVVQAGGGWVTAKTLKALDSRPTRPDRAIKRLPGPVRDCIEGKPGSGYRLKVE